jgi:hypothetical protein
MRPKHKSGFKLFGWQQELPWLIIAGFRSLHQSIVVMGSGLASRIGLLYKKDLI